MKITLLSEDAVRLTPEPGPLTIEAQSADQTYSPFHMLGSSLATCTFSVMYSWATHADLRADDLTIEVRWTFAEDPQRVAQITLSFDWPSLPERRLAAAHTRIGIGSRFQQRRDQTGVAGFGGQHQRRVPAQVERDVRPPVARHR
jgi:hypothetical protein